MQLIFPFEFSGIISTMQSAKSFYGIIIYFIMPFVKQFSDKYPASLIPILPAGNTEIRDTFR